MKEIRGPVYKDRCGHPQESYVGSFSIIQKKEKEYLDKKYDLYIYENNRILGAEACIRYGNDCCEYISPGNIVRLYKYENSVYYAAWQILIRHGFIKYERKENNGNLSLLSNSF